MVAAERRFAAPTTALVTAQVQRRAWSALRPALAHRYVNLLHHKTDIASAYSVPFVSQLRAMPQNCEARVLNCAASMQVLPCTMTRVAQNSHMR